METMLDKLIGLDTWDFSTRKWSPPVDITEENTCYLLKMEVPGVGRENLKVEVDAGRLKISGKKVSSKTEGYRYSEIGFGEFTRTFELPPKSGEAKVEYVDGVLVLKIPKGDGMTKQIQIR